MQELTKLNTLSEGNLSGVKILVTHIKPCSNCEQNIKDQIKEANTMGLSIVYPQQGVAIEL
jgi:cAMP phosphodiesterase